MPTTATLARTDSPDRAAQHGDAGRCGMTAPADRPPPLGCQAMGARTRHRAMAGRGGRTPIVGRGVSGAPLPQSSGLRSLSKVNCTYLYFPQGFVLRAFTCCIFYSLLNKQTYCQATWETGSAWGLLHKTFPRISKFLYCTYKIRFNPFHQIILCYVAGQ